MRAALLAAMCVLAVLAVALGTTSDLEAHDQFLREAKARALGMHSKIDSMERDLDAIETLAEQRVDGHNEP